MWTPFSIWKARVGSLVGESGMMILPKPEPMMLPLCVLSDGTPPIWPLLKEYGWSA